jgi:hypothetical protein
MADGAARAGSPDESTDSKRGALGALSIRQARPYDSRDDSERIAADILGFSVSSGAGEVVAPGGVFVVGGVGLQAAVEDADEAVRELA